MPCDSGYMEPTAFEREMTKVFCLLGELDGDADCMQHWHGLHPGAIRIRKAAADKAVASLCSRLQKHPDISKTSLEMQIWWRDHQKADRARLEEEMAKKKTDEGVRAALSKLTPYERKLLGW